MSKTLTNESRLALANELPSGHHRSAWIVFLCRFGSVVRHLALWRQLPRASQHARPRIPGLDEVVLAAGHEQALGRMPLHRTHVPQMALDCADQWQQPTLDAQTRSSRCSSNDQHLIVRSSEHVTKRASFGASEMSRIGSSWPSNVCRLFMLTWK